MQAIVFSAFKKGVRLLSGHGIARKFYPLAILWPTILRFFASHFHPSTVEVQGHRMFLDSKDAMCLSVYGVYEPLETELFKHEIKKGDVVIDIGANIGYYTLMAAKLVGEHGTVFAFEPDPSNFALLEKNVRTNGYHNVVLIQKAVADKTGRIKLYLCDYNMGRHRTYDPSDGSQSIEIESVRLDDYFESHDEKIDFIKMDIEGSEGKALQGMPHLLENNTSVRMMTEFWPAGLKRSGIDGREYLALLTRLGFQLCQINEDKKTLEPIDLPAFLDVYGPERDNVYTNLFCRRKIGPTLT